jgi:Cu(I)/Ag(I) efflux system membrane protein CusA/SilA
MAARLGHEFMPSLREGDLLYMPTTFPNISIEEAKRSIQIQDRLLRAFPEVERVFGKAGRSTTPTDPAPLSMVETVVKLKPPSEWRKVHHDRWWSGRVPAWTEPALRVAWPDSRRLTWDDLVTELDRTVRLPGWTNAWTMPIKTRIDMLSTGVRTPIGVKIFGPELSEIERIGIDLEHTLAAVPHTRSVYSDRNTGGLYVDIVPDREALARHGLTLGDVQDVIEAAVGGEPIEVTVAGRERYTINVRYPSALRQDVDRLRQVLVPIHGGGSAGRSGAGGMGGTVASPMGREPVGAADVEHVPLGQVADVRVVGGPPMIRDEAGMLVGYVYVDMDASRRDVGGYVDDAKRAVAQGVKLPPGYFLKWTGQYELLQQMQARMQILVPLTLLLVLMLLYANFGRIAPALIVLSSVPFALVGSVWLLALLHYNLSTAVWVGLIALVGLATQTGVVMLVYCDVAYARAEREGRIRGFDDIVEATLEGSVQRVRPKLMTVATMMIGLVPLLWSQGAGADVMKRVAAPMVGGLFTSAFLTLEIIPVVYTWWRWSRWKRSHPPGIQPAVPKQAAPAVVEPVSRIVPEMTPEWRER